MWSGKHKKQEKGREVDLVRTIFSGIIQCNLVPFAMEKENYPRTLMGLILAIDVEVVEISKNNLKSSGSLEVESQSQSNTGN